MSKEDWVELRDFVRDACIAGLIVFLLIAIVGKAYGAEPELLPPVVIKPVPRLPGNTVGLEAPPPASPNGYQARIEGVVKQMQSVLGQGDALVAKLHNTTTNQPNAAKQIVEQAATVLGSMADATSPTREMEKALTEARNTALTHRKAVEDMPEGSMTEEGKKRVLEAWDRVLRSSQTVEAGLKDTHDHLTAILKELRMRSNEIEELTLADEYQAALDSVREWVQNLEKTVRELHSIITPVTS